MQALWLENQVLSMRDILRPKDPSAALIKVRLSAPAELGALLAATAYATHVAGA